MKESSSLVATQYPSIPLDLLVPGGTAEAQIRTEQSKLIPPNVRPLHLLVRRGGWHLLIKGSRIVSLALLASALQFFAPLVRGQVQAPANEAAPEELSKADWTGIRAAYEAGRHAAFAVDGGYQARNPGQQWTTLFDGRGFRVTPDAGGWSWGLEFGRYGWGGDERGVSMPRCSTSEGQRVEYIWDDQLTEWYVNDQRGLEHGFTLFARPDDAQGTLALEFAIRGGLKAVVQAGGRDLCFVGEGGRAALNYSGLMVFDADGRVLDAHFEQVDAGLRLQIDDGGARYPITIDPTAQQAYLKASNSDSNDGFGASVAISDDTVVVGAHGESSDATGVNGDQGNNSLPWAGAAYVFVRSGTSWSQQAYLKASNTDWGDGFGIAVSISGDTVVVGAPQEESNARGVNGNQGNNSAYQAGAAYVFVRSGTSWSQQAYLKASNADVLDRFGAVLSVSGDTVVVGATYEDSSATGVNGNQGNNSAPWAGAAYVFVRSGTSWSQQAYLKASNTESEDYFGFVSVSGDTVVVAAGMESSNATGVNGDQGDNSAGDAGAAYVFVRNGTSWSQQAYLKASNTDAGDRFGVVSVSGDTIVVGATSEDSSATGVNGNQANNGAPQSGAAYIFVRSGTNWSQQAYLKASNTDMGDFFGESVSVSGDTLVVGTASEKSSATGVNGNQGDNSAASAGAAYVFVRSGTNWSQHAYLKASNTDEADLFGASVSVSGDTVVVGAHREDSGATGVDGNQADNSAGDAGAAYVFVVQDSDTGTAYCFGDGTGAFCPCAAFGYLNEGCVNSSGFGATMVGSGQASISADTLALSVAGVPGSKPGLLLRGDIQVAIPAGDGILCVSGGSLRSQVQVTDTSGATVFTEFNVGGTGSGAPLGSVATAGVEVNYQFWYRDTANLCGGGFNFTNAVAVTYIP